MERRLRDKKNADQVRAGIGLPSLSNDKCISDKYAKAGPDREQMKLFKKSFEVWNVQNSLLPESERKSLASYHREVIGHHSMSETAFNTYLVNGKPLPEESRMRASTKARSLVPENARYGFIDDIVDSLLSGVYTLDTHKETGLLYKPSYHSKTRLNNFVHNFPKFSGITDAKKKLKFYDTLKRNIEKDYAEKKKANVASATGGAKVGTARKLEGHVAL